MKSHPIIFSGPMARANRDGALPRRRRAADLAPMRRVIIESPYAGDVEANVRYARACLRDSVLRGEAPIASHLLYTQPGVLDDDVPEERWLGINAGLAWKSVAQAIVFYTDRGWSRGMLRAREVYDAAGMKWEERSLIEDARRTLPPL